MLKSTESNLKAVAFDIQQRPVVYNNAVKLTDCFITSVFRQFIIVIDKDYACDALLETIKHTFTWIDISGLDEPRVVEIIRKLDGGYCFFEHQSGSSDYTLVSLDNSFQEEIFFVNPDKNSSIKEIINLINNEIDRLIEESKCRMEEYEFDLMLPQADDDSDCQD